MSFWLRLWGIQFGLPFVYHPDEQQYILPAIGVVSGRFEPLAHYNPALYPYLIGVVYSLAYLGLKVFNAFPSAFDLNVGWSPPMQPWVTGMVYLARYISVAVGVLTTLMTYQLGRQAYNQTTGLAAAVIFGLTFLPAREAHYAVSDAPVALGTAATLYVCVDIIRRSKWSTYLWAGGVLGLSVATKYSAGLLILPLGVAHLLSQRYQSWLQRLGYSWLLGVAGVVAVMSYLVVSPYTWLEREEFWADFSENLESARVGFQGLELDPAGGAIFYLKGLIWGFGWPLFLLFLGAVVLAGWRRRRVDLLLLTLPLLGFFYMQRQEMYFVRWLMPFLPPLAVLAAELAYTGMRRLAAFVRGSNLFAWGLSVEWITVGAVILLTLPSIYVTLWADYVFSQLDTRTEALEWIRQNIPPGSNLAAEVLSPPWGPPLAMPGLGIGPYNLAPAPDGGVAELDIQQYRDWQVQYVVASSFHYGRVLRDKAHQDMLVAHLQALERQAELVAVFQPYAQEYKGYFYHDQVYGPADDTLYREQPGPVIKIYRLW
jgi:hypothetical protein